MYTQEYRSIHKSSAMWTVELDISKAFIKVWQTSVLNELRSYRILGYVFKLIFSFLGNRWLYVVLLELALLSVQLKPSYLKALFLDQLFPCCAWKIFLIMLYVVLIPMQVIPISPLNMTRLLFCSNIFSWCMNLNQALMTL